MRQFEYVVTEPVGIHARPAGMLVKATSVYKSNITVEKDGKQADVKRLMAIMALGIKNLEKVVFRIEGEDEEVAMEELKKFCEENL